MLKPNKENAKCVVTITQNKRVALPFIFGEYCLPKMRKWFGGEVELYHIFHDVHLEHNELESNRAKGKDHLETVRDFINCNAYPEATIVRHREVNWNHLALPSFRKAAEVAIERDADFHLWMEDDALVLDKNCHSWSLLLKDSDVGLYRDTRSKKMINCAFFVSSKGYDARFLDITKNYRRENSDYRKFGSQLEHTFWRASQGQVPLNSKYANRHHDDGKWAVYLPELKKWLKDVIPEISEEHLNYLHLDFDH